MKRIFTLIFLTTLFGVNSFAQKSHVNYDRDSRWFLGFNLGGTWTTQSEIDYRVHPGWGITLGRSIGMNPNKFWALDIRGRFLAADIGGQATERYTLDSTFDIGSSNLQPLYGNSLSYYQDSLGYFVPNYKTRLYSGSLELVLNTNRWREKSGLNFYIFGGLGIKGYNTKTDLFSGDTLFTTNIYDYDAFGSMSKSTLISNRDDVFETDLVGSEGDFEITWMPSVGAGISYQVAPWCALGLEHKMTWTRTNDFDGMPNNFDGTPSIKNDIYHYSGVSLKFHLWGGSHTVIEDDIVKKDSIPDPDPNVNTLTETPRQKPIVDIYDPSISPYTVTNELFKLQANVYYVAGKSNITFKHNGVVSTNFNYNANTDKFYSDVVLQPGQNIFEITGVNDAGSDYESTIIIYEKEDICHAPIVTITKPSISPYTTQNSLLSLSATALEVDSKSQISLYLNGTIVSGFSFNMDNKIINASLNLVEGNNTITITATNNCGSDSKTVNVIYNKPEQKLPPIVSFILPSTDPYLCNVPTYNVRAQVLNVASKAFISVKVNGFNTSVFTYNATTKEVYLTVALNDGANVIEIKGTNEVGSDVETTTIIYQKPEIPRPPIVTFINPNIDPITVYTSNYAVTAKVEYVDSKSDIQLKINGVPTTFFSWSYSSKLMTFNTNLLEGSNVIEIKGTNKFGSDIETTTIIYVKPAPKAPPIVTITYPAVDNKVFLSPNITLTSTVLNVESAANITVKVNGVSTTLFSYNPSTKILTLPLVLNVGNNKVEITGTNAAGTDSDTRIILHERPKQPKPPTVVITNPATTPYLSEASTFVFAASTTNIESKSQITAMLNGAIVSDADYVFTGTGQIQFSTDLIAGNNVFTVIVTNDDGSADDMAIVVVKAKSEPCVAPTVGYISPVPYSTVTEAGQTIDAQINNWSAGTIVELLINGSSVGYMTYNAGTSIASKAVTLNEGSNSVKVIVSNNCGTNQSTFTLNYVKPDAPCLDPTASVIGESTFTTKSTSVSLNAGVTNVDNSSQIKVTLNGGIIPFTYDAATGTVTISADLAIGNNTVLVTVTTDCGTAVASFHVTREECKKPIISAVSPVSGTVLETESASLSANIKNVSEAEITLLVNGVSQPFSYVAATGALTATVNLTIGENTISLIAKNECGEARSEVKLTRKKPCSAIVHNLISPATTSATSTEKDYSIELNAANITDAAQIKVFFNGSPKPFTFDAVTGNIKITGLTLNDGSNSVKVTMTNDCSSKEVNYNIEYKGCIAPTITINSIADGAVLTESEHVFMALVTNANSADDIKIKLNGSLIDFTYNEATKVVTAPFTLVEGSNTIEVIVEGCKTVSKLIKVTYTIPCAEISTALMIPGATVQTVVDASYEIKLTVTEVETAAQINVKQNGTSIPFTFDAASGTIIISGITLSDGLNTIVVNLSNACSKKTVTYSITYNGCKAPVIALGANPAAVENPSYTFTSTITNIAAAASLQFLVNGAPSPFVFDPATGAFTAELTLSEGSSTFEIIANGCEKASKTFTVKYTLPCKPLVYALNIPATLTTSVADPTYTIKLVAQYITADNITVTVNGSTHAFTYASDVITIPAINLADGDNVVVVKLKNDCSSETITYTVKHDNCNAPLIDMSANPTTSEVGTYTFNAIVSNIDAAAKLSLKLNGTAVPFDFNPATGALNATLSLTEGDNIIKLEANGCEKVTDELSVKYTIPCAPLSYTLNSPASTTVSVEDNKIGIILNTTKVAAKADVTVLLNGSPASFTFVGGIVNAANLTLNEGVNTVVVTLKNGCSTETVTYTITYTDPVKAKFDCEPDASGKVTICHFPPGAPDNPQTITISAAALKTHLDHHDDYCGPCAEKDNDDGDGDGDDDDGHLNCTPDASGKVTICHFPPGAPDNPQTITISAAALKTHLDHHDDYCGPCAEKDNDDGDGDDDGDDDGDGDGDGDADADGHDDGDGDGDGGDDGGHLDCTPDASGKVTICHYPPGAPDKPQTISISAAALATHVGHHDDYCGPCTDDAPDLGGGIGGAGGMGDPCETVVHTFINPNKATSTVSKGSIKIIMKATNLTGADGVIVTVNGSPYTDITYAAASGMVTLNEVPLNSGDNTILVSLRNACSTANVTYNISSTKSSGGGDNTMSVKDNPEIIAVAPSTLKSVVKSPTYNFTARVKGIDATDGIKLYLNGQLTRGVTYDKVTGTVKSTLTLKDGDNKIKISATNGVKTVEKEFIVAYNNPDNVVKVGDNDAVPVITMVSPNKATATSLQAKYTIKATITNIKTKNDIIVLVNGKPIGNHTYSMGTKQAVIPVTLKTGSNTIKVTAKNGAKMATVTYTIELKIAGTSGQQDNGGGGSGAQVAITPVITPITPASTKAETSQAKYTLKAKVEHVNSKGDIKVYINGKITTVFNYNATSKELSLTTDLRSGTNSIRIVATNGGKTANTTYSVEFKPAGGGSIKVGPGGDNGSGTIKPGGLNPAGGTSGSGTVKTGTSGQRGGGL